MLNKVWRFLRNETKRMWRDTWLNSIASSVWVPMPVRLAVYRAFGIRAQSVAPRCFFGGGAVRLGTGSWVNYGCFFDNSAPIIIGDNCTIAMEVMFCTTTHTVGGPEHRAGKAIAAPITVGHGCWIGARAVILPGVTIESGCVIAAGAVVTKDCESNGLYAGVPARRVRNLT